MISLVEKKAVCEISLLPKIYGGTVSNCAIGVLNPKLHGRTVALVNIYACIAEIKSDPEIIDLKYLIRTVDTIC